jgi:plastocyanin
MGLVITVTATGAARAQVAGGRVTGRVTILEKDRKASRDLGDAVLWLDARPDSTPPRTFDIAITDKVYTPRVVVAPVGSTVRFPNYDPFNHNVFSVSEGHAFDLGLFGRGNAPGRTFTAPGLVRVYCNIHPRMVAYVVVMASRLYTQPTADGAFAIADVPPGRYRLHAWHERIPAVQVQDVVVGSGSTPAVDVQLDARKYRWVQHKNKFGKTYPTNAGRERY